MNQGYWGRMESRGELTNLSEDQLLEIVSIKSTNNSRPPRGDLADLLYHLLVPFAMVRTDKEWSVKNPSRSDDEDFSMAVIVDGLKLAVYSGIAYGLGIEAINWYYI